MGAGEGTVAGARAAFAGRCAAAGVTVRSELLPRLEALIELLGRFNARTNLVGDAAVEAVLGGHVAETLALLDLVGDAGREVATVVDVGAGAGLEALVIALCRPGWRVWAIEPRRRRADFVAVAADHIGVGRCLEVVRARIDERGMGRFFDLATSRATFAPSRWLEVAGSLVRPDGLVAVHGRAGEAPERGDAGAWGGLGGRVVAGSGREVRLYRRG